MSASSALRSPAFARSSRSREASPDWEWVNQKPVRDGGPDYSPRAKTACAKRGFAAFQRERSEHRMIHNRLHTAIPVLAFVGWSLSPSLAAAGPCKDIPLRVTLYSVAAPGTPQSVSTALQSDGGEYVNGISASALIKICSGTHDAVINLLSTKRTFTF